MEAGRCTGKAHASPSSPELFAFANADRHKTERSYQEMGNTAQAMYALVPPSPHVVNFVFAHRELPMHSRCGEGVGGGADLQMQIGTRMNVAFRGGGTKHVCPLFATH